MARRRARRNSPLYMPGAFDLFPPSKELVLKNIWVFGPLYAVTLVFYIHSWIWSPLPNQHVGWWHNADGFSSGWPGAPFPGYFTYIAVGFSILWFLIIAFVGTVTQIMAQTAQLRVSQGQATDFTHLWAIVKDIGWRVFGLYIVMGILIVIGLILLVIPGLILIRRFFFAPFIMIDKKTRIRESLDQSAALSKVNTGAIWGVIGVMFLIGLANIIPIIGGLVAFTFGSLYSVAPALRYQQFKKSAAQ
jgi:hypothetical protein